MNRCTLGWAYAFLFNPGIIVLRITFGLGVWLVVASPALGNETTTQAPRREQARESGDRSGRELRGKATIFAPHLIGRRMADGGNYEPAASVVASSTLPLGTTARVTNLRNGKVAMVRVRDRIPGTDGRVLNVSSKVAEFLGVQRGGVFPVVVAPLAVPQADGGVLLGSGTGLAGRRGYVTGRRDRAQR